MCLVDQTWYRMINRCIQIKVKGRVEKWRFSWLMKWEFILNDFVLFKHLEILTQKVQINNETNFCMINQNNSQIRISALSQILEQFILQLCLKYLNCIDNTKSLSESDQKMSQFLTSDKMRYYSELFAQLDYFSVGLISQEQVYQVLRSMHIRLNMEDVNQLIRQTGNQTENCQVSLSEFLAIISIVIEDKDFNQQIYEVFKVFDINRNKVIDVKDFQLGFEKMDVELSKDDLLKMIQATGKSQFTLRDFRQFILDK